MGAPAPDEQRYLAAVLLAAEASAAFLRHMEDVGERLAPERLGALSDEIRGAHQDDLRPRCAALSAAPAPEPLKTFSVRFEEALGHVRAAFELFTGIDTAPPTETLGRILETLHHCARAQAGFYTLRGLLPSFADYWTLPDSGTAPPSPTTGSLPRTGVVHVSPGGSHGGFALYVPEYYQEARSWPLIVALHGGSGNGSDFLWTWLREARSCGYLLVAPTARGQTWSEADDAGLLEILAWLRRHYRIARDRTLLTGLSDGATFAILFGLAHPSVYRALAPLCGVLHPGNATIGNLRRARGVPIYLAHGARDFLFPVALARWARDTLQSAGAAVEYRELPDLSHTYPRSENVRILRWFEDLPERFSAS